MSNLFKGYLVTSGMEFVRYIRMYQGKYDDIKDISTDKLTNLALNKCLTLVGNEERNTLLPEAGKIVALTSVVDKLKDNNLKLSDRIQDSLWNRSYV